ncbi:RNA 2',3'-cyclic phosphodiesterase [Bythopirellula polymerisocia]|uniref:RNA 2',3'-cyclic phosphodiesterase n=1 Tax=Bythopirellula polymerisocia TaxID=2528003 RepID=A0A5C6CEI4_9BACT|nr:RNA 2',3'-cyclic phosphodiesterase [Bythopirellula polymerisocia]TWU21924.1 2',5' RNA ligase family [Bythopirellula polymerisocia]
MAKTRTFIAVEASDGVHTQAQQVISRLRPHAEQVKWVEPENLHWTLQFLGDLTDEEIAEVCRRVQRVASRLEPFSLAARGIGAFPKSDRPRTLWLGVGEGSDEFCQLQAAIERNLEDLGFRGELRKFVPHLTLGRVGSRTGNQAGLISELNHLSDFDGGAMSVDEVVVFASRLSRSGATYVPLSHSRLGE